MDVTDADDDDLEESLSAFEGALSAKRQSLVAPELQRILLALDGSNQDDTSSGLAVSLARRTGAHIVPIVAWEGGPDAEREGYLMQRAHGLRDDDGVAVDMLDGVDHWRRPFDQILAACAERHCDLIVADAPYLEDFSQLGDASVGTTLDVLLARSPVPVLVARAPLADPFACFRHVLLPIVLRSAEQPRAAAWSLRVLEANGRLRVVAVVDHDHILRCADWLEPGTDLDAIDDHRLAGLREPKNAGIIGALQREAAKGHFACRVSVRTGELLPAISEIGGSDPHLVVAPCPRDPTLVSFHLVQALVRISEHPVLVV